MTVPLVIIASTIGAVLGALILYWIGYLLNEERLEKIFNHKLFKILGFKKGDVKKQSAGLINTEQVLFFMDVASL